MIQEKIQTPGPYSIPDDYKITKLKPALMKAFEHHYENCLPYRKLCERRGFTPSIGDFELKDLPYLPADIFKYMRLSSVDDSQIVRTLQSSGTSSQRTSSVIVDNITRQRQVKNLMWLMADAFGSERRPFVIIDVDPSANNKLDQTIPARSAAIRGFLASASSTHYCMQNKRNGTPEVNVEKLAEVLDQATVNKESIVLCGFTYVFYTYAAKQLIRLGKRFHLPNATILHIGGWKKLQDEAVDKRTFNSTMEKVFGIPQNQVIDAYGFTEQLGLVYMDCPDGFKRVPSNAEIIIRDPFTLEPVPDGQEGLVEFITPLPHSYPGIAILQEDLGRVVTRKRCICGRHGTAFEILGRLSQVELRGCGDVLAEAMAGRM